MSGQEFISKKEKLDFKDLVLQHLKRILEHSKNEFRQRKKIIPPSSNMNEVIILEENEAIIFIQMVELFSYILKPYFDEKITPKYNQCIKIINLSEFDYAKEHKKEMFEAYDILVGGEKPTSIPYDQITKILTIEQLKQAKILFVELNMLLHRIDYLKGTIYSEDSEETEEPK